jgi:hypothetical protein
MWNQAREKEDRLTDGVKEAFMNFREMIQGGYTDNQIAHDYMKACAYLNLDPADPHWMVKQPDGTEKKATLFPGRWLVQTSLLDASARQASILYC